MCCAGPQLPCGGCVLTITSANPDDDVEEQTHHTSSPSPPPQLDQLRRSTKLLGMYVNRANSASVEAQQWAAPYVFPQSLMAAWAMGDHFPPYKADVL